MHRPTLETRTCQQASRQRSGNGNHQTITEVPMLQLPRYGTHQAKRHKQQQGAICHTKIVLATQFYDTQRCQVQRLKENHNTENQPQREVQSAHSATESTATEEEDDFGYAFLTSGWAPSAGVQGTAQRPREGRLVLTHPGMI